MSPHRTLGEIMLAAVSASLAAILAAVAGFVGVIFLCSKLLEGELGKRGLFWLAAIVLAMVAFAVCYRKIITYGEP